MKTVYPIHSWKQIDVISLQIAELVEPVVTEACKSLKPIKFNNTEADDTYDNDRLLMGTTLFELYLIVQRFAV